MSRIAPGPRRFPCGSARLACSLLFASTSWGQTPAPTVFVHDGAAGELRSFAYDARSAELAEVLPPLEILGGATECAAGCGTLAASADGTWLAASSGSGLELFRRGVDGRLARTLPLALRGTGALSGITLVEPARSSELRVYVADRTRAELRFARIDRAQGSAAWDPSIAPLGSPGGPAAVVHGAGRLYVAQPLDGRIHVFALDPTSGAPTAVPGSPFAFAGLQAPSELRLDRRARTLIANDERSGSYAVFALEATNGIPLPPTLIPSSASATHLFALARNGRTLYGGGREALEALDLRRAEVRALPRTEGPRSGILDARGKRLFVFSGSAADVHALRRATPVDPPSFAARDLLTLSATGIVVLRR